MKFILLLILSMNLTSKVHAYSRDQLKLSDNEFITQVRPQFNNIFQDYQTLLSNISTYEQNYKSVFKDFQNILASQTKFKESCQVESNSNCKKILASILKDLQNVILTFPMPTKLLEDNTLTPLKTINQYNTVHSLIMSYYTDIFNFNFLYHAEVYNKPLVFKLERDFSSLFYQFQFFMISLVENRYQEALNSCWSSFFRPIVTQILFTKDKEVFLSRLNDMNLSWNVFHAYVTKRNEEIPKKLKSIMTIMQSRWNTILKATLR